MIYSALTLPLRTAICSRSEQVESRINYISLPLNIIAVIRPRVCTFVSLYRFLQTFHCSFASFARQQFLGPRLTRINPLAHARLYTAVVNPRATHVTSETQR